MPRLAFEGLEPCDGRLSRTVLRGLGDSNVPRLPGLFLTKGREGLALIWAAAHFHFGTIKL